ncbi:TatD family hydrolase [Candidatus Saccharibacteria bacterium]|nr:TatD family hydrolase [Candidatus Saccharibacteria bacterium]
MHFTDTHCHIHQDDYPLDAEEVLVHAEQKDIRRLICVGVDEQSSREAIDFSAKHTNAWASVGVHPHEAQYGIEGIKNLIKKPKVIAIGECGLDYFYTHSSKEDQIKALEQQIDLAISHNLPLIFHVREAFDGFWPVLNNFKDVKGVLHSFTGTMQDMQEGLKRGLFFGINGISTFTKDEAQQKMFAAIPLKKIMLETDAPFLTPKPHRGKKNEPAFTLLVAEHLAKSRHISLEELSKITEKNVSTLFRV